MRLTCLLMILPFISIGQPIPVPVERALSISDKIPSLTVYQVINDSASTLSIDSSSGKATIVDFWATWCTSCLASIRDMDSLQKQFGGRLRILLVTSQPAAIVEPFIKKNKILSKVKFPVITSDTLLRTLFPHGTVPHTVWIDQAGTIKAITNAKAVNQRNIADFLAGKMMNLALKKEVMDYDPEHPLLENGNGGEGRLQFTSRLSTFLPGMGKRAYYKKLQQGQKIIYINHSIPELYQMALSTSFDNRLVIEAPKKIRYIKPANTDDWEKDHSYSYELFVPPGWSRQKMGTKMKQDIDLYFRLSVSKEKRTLKCYVITNKENGITPYRSKGGKPFQGKDNDAVFRIRNKPFSVLMKELNRMQPWESFEKPIILNETGYEGNIDISISASLYPVIDLERLRKDLNKAGLDLKPVDRDIEVFVMTETNDN